MENSLSRLSRKGERSRKKSSKFLSCTVLNANSINFDYSFTTWGQVRLSKASSFTSRIEIIVSTLKLDLPISKLRNEKEVFSCSSLSTRRHLREIKSTMSCLDRFSSSTQKASHSSRLAQTFLSSTAKRTKITGQPR